MTVGAIIENMSGRKVGLVVGSLILCEIVCFLLGAVVSPRPNSSDNILATKCIDYKGDRKAWFYSRGPGQCPRFDSFDDNETMPPGLTAENVVFTFQLPLPKENSSLDFSRWQQTLIGILSADIVYEDEVERESRVPLMMDVRLGYRNKRDAPGDWKEYASSSVARNLDCDIDEIHKVDGHYYNCSILPLFDLGSLHHDYYLLNIRIPSIFESDGQVHDINDKLGKLVDLWLITIYQNGGFTMIWVALKTIFFPVIIVELIWFWRRITLLARSPTLLEKMLLTLGCALSLLNIPIEYFTLIYDIPWINVLSDIKQGIFYATLLAFWMIFAGEHLLNDTRSLGERDGIYAYWKKLAVVFFGCLCLFIFDMCERGVQLRNPFYSIWVTDLGTNLALGFIIMAGISAGIYFLFLCYLIYQVFRTISDKRASISTMPKVRRLRYEGIIWRFRFLMLATVITAMMTVIGFIIGQVSEGQYKWDEDISLEYTSGFMTGVYGMWNIYVFGLLFLYAPSHKKWTTEDRDAINTGDEIEFTIQSGNPGSEISRFATNVEPSELSSLTEFFKHQSTD
ncbi:protein wntless [Lepeophtheirus salmonis]|uniref:protein wntless n=1 Tax=Lepeophtheirus salmonis TaxID=72036 RepID=UPI001AEA1CB7|nr:protein wntless-like [Lepeophtheirus salmonis]